MFKPAYNKHAICSVNATLFSLVCLLGIRPNTAEKFFFKFSLEFFSCFSVFHQLSLPNQQVYFSIFLFAHKKKVKSYGSNIAQSRMENQSR